MLWFEKVANMIDKIVKLKTILERFFMGILKNFCRYVLEDEISRYSTIIIDKNNEIDRLNYTSKQQEKDLKFTSITASFQHLLLFYSSQIVLHL